MRITTSYITTDFICEAKAGAKVPVEMWPGSKILYESNAAIPMV